MLHLCGLVLLWAGCPSPAAGRLRVFYFENKSTKINITEARSLCTGNYTDLVTIYNEQDNQKLSVLLQDKNAPSAWIGFYKGLKWSDETVATIEKFSWMEKGCATMRSNSCWECIDCNSGRNFTCYDRGQGNKTQYYTLVLQNKTWNDALQYCRKKHTDLVSIRNDHENQQVNNAGRNSCNPFWIGLKCNSRASWFDNGQSTYSNFTDNGVDDYFTYMHLNGSWQRSKTTESAGALCYKSFIHVSKATMIWEDALEYCNVNASGLLRIESKEDQIETERELTRQKITDPVWIGLRQSRLFGFWMWVNGLHVGSWSNWKDGRQPEHQLSHHCGAMEKTSNTFKWSDKDCRYRYRVLCEEK